VERGEGRAVTPLLSIRSLIKRFGEREVLRGVSLDVASGEFLTILGESGSGKTTLLRMIAGFEQPDSGEIWMGDERLEGLPAYRRPVNTVFQSYALFPHLSVRENVAYGLRAQGAPRAGILGRVEQALAMVKMTEFARQAPARLSGGQQQRVALARALVNRPKLLLLDEPLSALDANLRRQMQTELKSLQREVGITFLFVTHDQDEAMALSDRIALLRAGGLEQVATPREIYNRPETAYVAQFIGQTNILRAEISGGVACAGTIAWRWGGSAYSNGTALFSLRPESIRVVPPAETSLPSEDTVRFRARVVAQTFGGAIDIMEIVCPDGQALRIRVPAGTSMEGEQRFEFDLRDAVAVRTTGSAAPAAGEPPDDTSSSGTPPGGSTSEDTPPASEGLDE
jgi:ABC-type Fe3+/spermidine/putrescine transport system ATPase subunit